MHFWIDKRSPYGFGRGARVSGSGFGQYPRRLRPSKPWSNNRSSTTATTPTSSSDRNPYPAHSDLHHYHHPHHHSHQPSHYHANPGGPDHGDDNASPSYFKWSLWAFAIALSSLLFYIVLAKMYHDHQMFTFCALLAIVFILGVCILSTMFRRTANDHESAPSGPLVANTPPAIQMLRQESSSSSGGGRDAAGSGSSSSGGGVGGGGPHHQVVQPNNSHTLSTVADNRSPSISIHNLAESPTPYHHSHNQYSPPPYHIALEMHFPDYVKNCDEISLPTYDKIQQQQHQHPPQHHHPQQ